MKAPDWLHIWTNENEGERQFGQLYWDFDKIQQETTGTVNLYLIITATFGGKTAYSNDLHFGIKADQ
jgi:hypothetical protein